jgi:hypothetical protein
MYGLPTQQSDDSLRPSSGTRTPVAGFGNAMVLSGARVEEELYLAAGSDDEDLTTMGKGRRELGLGTGAGLEEGKSGIGWKFANQGTDSPIIHMQRKMLMLLKIGLSLLSLAVDESSSISQNPRFGNASFARQLYIHALTYLLRALPSDLTTEEQLSVRSSLPPGVVEPLHLSVSSPPQSTTPTQPSVLHRTLASTIVQFFILFQFIVPYLKHLLSVAYQYDREHKISEKVLKQGIETVDRVGKKGLGVSEAVMGMGDGRVGQAMVDFAGWVVEGVTGGIHEGLGEGLLIMGARRQGQGVSVR